MAHFAQLDNNNKVIQVIVVADEECLDRNGREREWVGQRFLRSLFGDNTRWVQTSFNGNRRVRYAGVGYSYDEQRDAFIPPKPFDSWLLDEPTLLWKPPVEMPTDDQNYEWSEEDQNWIVPVPPKQYNWNEEAQRWDEI